MSSDFFTVYLHPSYVDRKSKETEKKKRRVNLLRKMLPCRGEVTGPVHLGNESAAECGGTRWCRGQALVWPPPQTAQGVQEPWGSLHRDITWSVEDAGTIPSEGWQGERNTSTRKVSESRTREVFRRNLTRLNTLHTSPEQELEFFSQDKGTAPGKSSF